MTSSISDQPIVKQKKKLTVWDLFTKDPENNESIQNQNRSKEESFPKINYWENLFTREENRGTARTLIITTCIMVIAPISTFFLCEGFFFKGIDDPMTRLTYSGICAVIMVNCVIVGFVIYAFKFEKIDDEPDTLISFQYLPPKKINIRLRNSRNLEDRAMDISDVVMPGEVVKAAFADDEWILLNNTKWLPIFSPTRQRLLHPLKQIQTNTKTNLATNTVANTEALRKRKTIANKCN